MTIKIGIVAGEASGDLLGAGLMAALKEYLGGPETSPTQVRFIGVGGPAMLAAGLEPLAALEDLSVNGFKDPILRLPALLKLFRSLRDTCLEEAVDVFVGVDFNVFNLLLEKSLKKRGVKTVHYVSPSVYAWRTGRTRKIARSADLLLCLFPFEPDFYTNTAVKAVFVGHPLADQVDPPTTADADKMKQLRTRLNLPLDAPLLGLLPGSRRSEVGFMIDVFLQAARLFRQRLPNARVVIPCVTPAIHAQVVSAVEGAGLGDFVVAVQEPAREVLAAADVALIKSGTSTLEGMLLRCPMVVSYRLGSVTFAVVKRLVHSPHVALPNILSGRGVVPEYLQDDATPENLCEGLLSVYAAPDEQLNEFSRLHSELRRDANATAARAVIALMGNSAKGAG